MKPVRQRRAARARPAVWLIAVVVAALAIAGCTTTAVSPAPVATPLVTDSAAPSDTASIAPSDTSDVPDSPVAGIVVAVDAVSLTDVRGFTLKTNDGETVVFTIGTLENGDEFPPGHLKEHQTSAAPILVFFRVEGGKLVVYRIEDAG